MSNDAPKNYTQPYSGAITVTFDGRKHPFTGTVYNQGDGSHAVFEWPFQPSTPETTELAEFATQTKWVTKQGKCVKSGFTGIDPKFVCMVSHAGYEQVSSGSKRNEYLSADGVRCAYLIDEQGREVILSIIFDGTKIEFDNVQIADQEVSRFIKPR